MQLIRKRLKVEFWLDDQLRFLYDIKVNLNDKSFFNQYEFFKDDNSEGDHEHCPGDLIDSLLDIDDESERRVLLLVSFCCLSSFVNI
jgi:hypothetical protein